jgi:hypothetical protein
MMGVPIALAAAPFARACLLSAAPGTRVAVSTWSEHSHLPAALCTLVVGLLNVERFGPTAASALAPALAGLGMLSWFVWWGRRHSHPLVPVEVFAVRSLTIAGAASRARREHRTGHPLRGGRHRGAAPCPNVSRADPVTRRAAINVATMR